MNKEIEKLYKKLDAQDKIINTQALEIARLKEDKKKAIEYIKNNTYFKDNVVKTIIFKDFSNNLLEILGDKENECKRNV